MTRRDPFLEGTFWDKFCRPIRSSDSLTTLRKILAPIKIKSARFRWPRERLWNLVVTLVWLLSGALVLDIQTRYRISSIDIVFIYRLVCSRYCRLPRYTLLNSRQNKPTRGGHRGGSGGGGGYRSSSCPLEAIALLNQGALKGLGTKVTENPQNTDFAENRRFSQIQWKYKHLEGAGNRRKPQIFAENSRFSQKTAGNRSLGSVTLGPSPLARPNLKKRERVREMGMKPLKVLEGYRASNRGSKGQVSRF